MTISNEEVIKLAQLARLNITDKEVSQYAHQLTDILNYAEQIQNFTQDQELTETEKAIQMIDSQKLRQDNINHQNQDVINLLLQSVPQKHGNFVKSPKAL